MFNITVEMNFDKLQEKLNAINVDENAMLEIHNTFAKMINDYVPMDEGVLSQDIEITPEYVRYVQPYAHYQYVGEVYSPNIPIKEDGEIVGWFSPPGQKKHPTGKDIQYSVEKHPLATKEWDKVAMQTKKDEFEIQVKQILQRRGII